jgi:hypothetical protein
MTAGSLVFSRNPCRAIGCLPALSHAAPFGQRHAPSGATPHTENTPKPCSANHVAALIRSSAEGRGVSVAGIMGSP